MKKIAIVFLLVSACATASTPAPPQQPAQAPPPEFKVIPAVVLDAMCVRLHDEGFSREQVIDLVIETRPLVNGPSLAALAEAAFYKGKADAQLMQEAIATNDLKLPIAKATGCAWHPVTATATPRSDAMRLEISAPFTPPFKKGGLGVLTRLSLGGEAPMWYWIPLFYNQGVWIAGQPAPLGLHQ